MKLSQTNGPGASRSVRQFWAAVEKAPPEPGCEDCNWPHGPTCESCRAEFAQSLINAERVS